MTSRPETSDQDRKVAWLWSVSQAGVVLLGSLFFFSPRWWILHAPMPGSTYWDRGLQFMQQCEAPFNSALTDPALVWRIGPALLANLIGLHGYWALAVPWLGLVLLLTLSAEIIRRRTADPFLAFWTTAVVGSTSATLIVTGWLGMNDAWYASALLAVSFMPAPAVVAAACFAGPWVDERFVLALPLAFWVRHLIPDGKLPSGWRMLRWAVPGLAFYFLMRVFSPLAASDSLTQSYLQFALHNFQEWLPWTSLGWFMGLRAGWLLVFLAVAGPLPWNGLGNTKAGWTILFALAPMAVITLLAADTGRTTTMLLPLLLLATLQAHQHWGASRIRWLLKGILMANLLLPAMHVTNKNGDIINMLPVELVRYFRHP